MHIYIYKVLYVTICIFLEWYRTYFHCHHSNPSTLAHGRYIKHWALKHWGKWFPLCTIHLMNCAPAAHVDQEAPTCTKVRKALWSQDCACNFLLLQRHGFFSSLDLCMSVASFSSTFFSDTVSYAYNIIILFQHTLDFTQGSSHLVNIFSYVLYCDSYTLCCKNTADLTNAWCHLFIMKEYDRIIFVVLEIPILPHEITQNCWSFCPTLVSPFLTCLWIRMKQHVAAR